MRPFVSTRDVFLAQLDIMNTSNLVEFGFIIFDGNDAALKALKNYVTNPET